MSNSTYRVKDWNKFQHFKDRKPPWIKLYRDLLDDLDWHKLDPKTSKVLVMLWLIASEDEGRLPDVDTLAFRLRMTDVSVKKALTELNHWLIQDDITAISQRDQDDALEREERERREREEKEREFVAWFDSIWSAFGKLGVKKVAKRYARAYSIDDRAKISKAIPVYLKCVAAGRRKSQFEGWINPDNRKWSVDWIDALAQLQRPAVRPAPASNGSDYQVVT